MSISFGLGANLKLGTSQKLTPQMQQAIKLLQMSSIELEQEIQIQLDRNPMLERDENSDDALDNAQSLDEITEYNDNAASASSEKETEDLYNSSSSETDTYDKLEQSSIDEGAMDAEWDNIYTSAPASLAVADLSELQDFHGNTTATIQDHIRWQLNFKHLSDTDKLIADYLIDSMGDEGFISLDIDELYQSLLTISSFYQWEANIEKDEIEAVLHIIQSCDPIGVGARNLAECLQIQLNKLDADTVNAEHKENAIKLLQHAHYFLSNNIKALLAETNLSVNDVEPALALIRTLNPAPGNAFSLSQPSYGMHAESYDVPDVLVSMVSDMSHSISQTESQVDEENLQEEELEIVWQVRLNPDILPKLRINQEYASLVKRGDSSADNLFLKENLSNAKLFIRSIQERNQNLLKVAICIVKRQEQFLLHGATKMQPLILKEVADEVKLHESTVSRITTSKSMLTPQGLFSLKYFFSSSVASNQGDVSSTAICAMIEEIIVSENPKKPYSDNAIVQLLNDKGIDIARRTVAKYREQLNIGSSTQRKQKF